LQKFFEKLKENVLLMDFAELPSVKNDPEVLLRALGYMIGCNWLAIP